MSESKLKNLLLQIEVQKLLEEKLASGEWTVFFDGEKHFAATPDGEEFEIEPQA
jgi:hypothetical protein